MRTFVKRGGPPGLLPLAGGRDALARRGPAARPGGRLGQRRRAGHGARRDRPAGGRLRRACSGAAWPELHALGADRFGAARTFIGPLEVPEPACEDWPSYYAQARLEPLLRMAVDAGALPDPGPGRARHRPAAGAVRPGRAARPACTATCGRATSCPARDGEPWLIDPSAYGGHREIDLAMLQLFGSPAAAFFAAYEDVTPLADGWRDRVDLYQLLPLLVHAVLFGGSLRRRRRPRRPPLRVRPHSPPRSQLPQGFRR